VIDKELYRKGVTDVYKELSSLQISQTDDI